VYRTCRPICDTRIQPDEHIGVDGTAGQGGGGRNSGGAGRGFNLNWDAHWTVRAQNGDFGWSAEVAIPLKTLRFNDMHEERLTNRTFIIKYSLLLDALN